MGRAWRRGAAEQRGCRSGRWTRSPGSKAPPHHSGGALGSFPAFRSLSLPISEKLGGQHLYPQGFALHLVRSSDHPRSGSPLSSSSPVGGAHGHGTDVSQRFLSKGITTCSTLCLEVFPFRFPPCWPAGRKQACPAGGPPAAAEPGATGSHAPRAALQI